MNTLRKLFPALLLAVGGCFTTEAGDISEEPSSVEATPRAPTCDSLQLGTESLRLAALKDGTYPIDRHSSVAVSFEDRSFDWEANLGIDAVIVSGGNSALVYHYDPEAFFGEQLHAPLKVIGPPFGIESIEFCFDYELEVTATASTSFQRQLFWSLSQEPARDSLFLSSGQTFLMPYKVTAGVAGQEDSDFLVKGMIVVSNPAPVLIVLSKIEAAFEDGGSVELFCGALPRVLFPGDRVVCKYTAERRGGESTSLTVKAIPHGFPEASVATIRVDFGEAKVDLKDECVELSDRYLGEKVLCAGQPIRGPFSYEAAIGPFEGCSEVVHFANSASLRGLDSGERIFAHSEVVVELAPCDRGCVLSEEYWRTHSQYGPAPYDKTWSLLGEDTLFYRSGVTYYNMLQIPPEKGPYYTLGRAYIAALLNQLDGALLDEITASALYRAEDLLTEYSPRAAEQQRETFFRIAKLLDAFNQGELSLRSCSE